MAATSPKAAALSPLTDDGLALSGSWTSLALGPMERRLLALHLPAHGQTLVVDAAAMQALDTAGAWLLNTLVSRLRSQGATLTWQGLSTDHAALLDAVAQQQRDVQAAIANSPAAPPPRSALARTGQYAVSVWQQAQALLSFVGESAAALAGCVAHPARLRWRPVLFNIRQAGIDALPIVGLLSFLLGVVVAYQGAEQLRRYGANIFVADLVGVSMLREFAPLITAIIIAGRSGSAYAAQIGTMGVTEEIDALRTMGLAPLEVLVLPKLLALVIVMPLLTAYADALGVLGGMLMARSQLDVGFPEFLARFVKAVSPTTYGVGLAKAPVFAVLIAMTGCFQGFQTRGGADSVGRHTTRAVVQAIFAVIVADAAFSVAFSALGL